MTNEFEKFQDCHWDIDKDNEHEDFYLQIRFVRLGHLWHRNVTTPKCGFLGQKIGKSIQYLCIQNMENVVFIFDCCKAIGYLWLLTMVYSSNGSFALQSSSPQFMLTFRLARQCQLFCFAMPLVQAGVSQNHNSILDDHLLGHWWRHDSFLIRHVSGTALRTGETLINVTKLSRFEYPDTCLCRKHCKKSSQCCLDFSLSQCHH